jgi:hypothetical protein
MFRREPRQCIGRWTIDWYWRTEAVYRTVCVCVEEKCGSVSDGSNWLEEIGGCISIGH